MKNRICFAAAAIAVAASGCAESSGERVPFDVQVSSLEGSPVDGLEVKVYDSLDAWIQGTSPAESATTDADGMTSMQLVEGENAWFEVRTAQYETNWGSQIIFKADQEPIVIETERNGASAMMGKTWEVVGAEADTAAGGAPTQAELDCWIGATFTITRSSGRSGPASATTAPGCSEYDFSFYDEWSENTGTGFVVREAGNSDRFAQVWNLAFNEDSLSARTSYSDTRVAPAEASVVITMQEAE